MNKKKGFTLVELLAIIVILAVIAVITVPIILNIIENSKKGTAVDSAYGYKSSISNFYIEKIYADSNFSMSGDYTVNSDGSISDSDDTYLISFSGISPSGGSLFIENGNLKSGCLVIDEYAITFSDGKVVDSKKGSCDNTPQIVEEFPKVDDSNPGIVCGNGRTEEDYENSSICYIYSVEDLVAFSNLVESGKDFSNKTVKLMNNLDIINSKSYSDSEGQLFGDVNGDSEVSSLIIELTKEGAKGFKPIGSSNSNAFSGVFDGNGKKIKNLYINYTGRNYDGFFGYNKGTVKGLIFENADVYGTNYVGIVAGYSNGSITSVIVDGDVHGGDYIGLVAGVTEGPKVEAIASGDVVGTGYPVAGIVGQISGSSSPELNAAYISGSVTGSASPKKIYCTSSSSASMRSVSSDSITVNQSIISGSSYDTNNGYSVSSDGLQYISVMNMVLDTYMGGDNNNDGYYYDYDENGNFSIYDTSTHPLTITMQGNGTSSPYLINNYDELKQVALDPTKNYKLNADIDLEGKGSIVLSNELFKFTGTFDGNTHVIKNESIVGINDVGLFGYVSGGTIKGLKIDKINVTGIKNVGVLVGKLSDNSSVESVIVNGNVTGDNCLGIVAGGSSLSNIEAVVSGNVVGTGHPSAGIVGEAVGNSPSTIVGAYLEGSVRAAGSPWRIVSSSTSSVQYKGIASDTVTVNNNSYPAGSGSISGVNGKSYDQASLGTSAPYEEIGFNFSDTATEYIWFMDNGSISFKKN